MLVGNKVLPEPVIEQLLEDICRKKELQSISRDFARDKLYAYLQQHRSAVQFLGRQPARHPASRRSEKYRTMVKAVRKELRQVYGVFRVEEEMRRRRELFEKYLSTSGKKKKECLLQILATHSSTRERLSWYAQLYRKLFSFTGKPQSIIDLGCGMNPLSFPFMGLRKCRYYAFDISWEEIDILRRFFSGLEAENPAFQGTAEILDIFQWAGLAKLEKADVCFLFKMTDVLDRGRGHKATEAVIKIVPARWVIVSFPTRTMSGVAMNVPHRKWFAWLCRRLGYRYRSMLFENEIFYVVDKGES